MSYPYSYYGSNCKRGVCFSTFPGECSPFDKYCERVLVKDSSFGCSIINKCVCDREGKWKRCKSNCSCYKNDCPKRCKGNFVNFDYCSDCSNRGNFAYVCGPDYRLSKPCCPQPCCKESKLW